MENYDFIKGIVLTRSILFDLDGVIIDSMPTHAHAWQLACKQILNVQISKEFIYQVEGKTNAVVIHEISESFMKPLTIGPELAVRVNERKNRIFSENFQLKAVPGVVELIKKLRELDYRLGVATGSNRNLTEEMLNHLGVRSFFSAMVCGEDVIHCKPHPEPYLKLLERLQGSKLQSLVIENAPLGVQSANAAGLTCLALTSNNDAVRLKEATLVFDSHKDIWKKLEKEHNYSGGKGEWKLFSDG